jgi:hypothetical protein
MTALHRHNLKLGLGESISPGAGPTAIAQPSNRSRAGALLTG